MNYNERKRRSRLKQNTGLEKQIKQAQISKLSFPLLKECFKKYFKNDKN